MIKNILDLLKLAKGETETIKIAQGKYLLPDTIYRGLQQVKKESQWEKQ